jgi:hypothetical protein
MMFERDRPFGGALFVIDGFYRIHAGRVMAASDGQLNRVSTTD